MSALMQAARNHVEVVKILLSQPKIDIGLKNI